MGLAASQSDLESRATSVTLLCYVLLSGYRATLRMGPQWRGAKVDAL